MAITTTETICVCERCGYRWNEASRHLPPQCEVCDHPYLSFFADDDAGYGEARELSEEREANWGGRIR